MHHSRPFRHAALSLGAAASLLAAGGARAETLTQALVQAYQTNPQILAARDLLRATDEQVAQAISLLRPTATATFNGGFATTTSVDHSTSPPGRFGSRTRPASASLTLTQPIYRGGKEYAEIKRAEATIRAQRARLHNTEQDIFFQVVTAYMNVVRDEATFRLRINNVAVLQRQLQAVRDRFNVGEVTRTDVAQAEAAVAGAEAQRVRAQGDLESSRAVYVNLVGHPPVRLAEPRPPIFLPAAFGLLLSTAKATNPTIIAATYDEFAARHNVRSIIGELLPQVSLNGSLSRGYDPGSQPDRRVDSASLTVTVTVPLYESGSVYSRTRAAKQTVFQRGNDLAQARRSVEQLATQAWQALQTARASVRSFQSQVRANGVALEGVRQENQAGLRTVLDVLNAQQTLLDSQVSLVSARRDVIVASYQVAQAMGKLTAVDLRLPVLVYDATAYYRAIKYLPFGTGPSTGAPPPKPGAAPPPNPGATSSAQPPRPQAGK
ncbi:MAG TPA: TolC family outer membrane protein [Alphaproteobacteria bacterium]|jgi:TolC family type I secretion outer membrane protein